ncbi:MAG: ATP-binding protein [Longimicrobiales bacterium]|nr:ATP-binding protein [Longimicrobiales bacterium]
MREDEETPTQGSPPEHPSLGADRLFRPCNPDGFDFETTDELDELTDVVGQERASRAVRFGVGIEGEGLNIFALGPEEADKEALVRKFVEERAEREEAPSDTCYVNNFDAPGEPRTMILPSGTARELVWDLDDALGGLRTALETAFESEEYQNRRQALHEEASQEEQESLEQLQERAEEKGLNLIRTPGGFVFVPIRDGETLSQEEVEGLPEEEREKMEEDVRELQQELQQILRQVPRLQRKGRERVRKLNQEIARITVQDVLSEVREAHSELDQVMEHLDAVEEDVVDRIEEIMSEDGGRGGSSPPWARAGGEVAGVGRDPVLRRYRINALVTHDGDDGHAPVIYEENPTYPNLVGRVEYLPVMGALIADFNLIKPGALHRANGGYLILDARQVLLHPFAWEGLKRTLKGGRIRIESPREAMGLVTTVSLDPEPVELDVKVVLLGSRFLYYLLSQTDPDFTELFRVEADFDDRMDRSSEAEGLYARMVASLVKREALRPFDRSGVARVVERSARIAGDGEKLTARTRRVVDLLRESSYWAGEDGADVVSKEHVQRAVDEWVDRASRVRERIQEEILRDTVHIDTDGEAVGQVNGLSVLQLGEYAFGRPVRITARVRLGRGEVVDIEREVELGGPLHSKGVLILTGFLGQRYASDRPLSLSASLVFEQSYAGIEGDSASSAELYALLSAVGGIPLSQSVAVTGSVNQHGRVQAIGGVNEKIEGFFDICSARGLTGDQGVLIPASNVKHLMLREDVRSAVAEGRFNVWAVETVDEGMEILSGLAMGERDEAGEYPEGSVNRRVEGRLAELAEERRELLPLPGDES